jgi:glycosyltransferase involved in cell wall biosynthesis
MPRSIDVRAHCATALRIRRIVDQLRPALVHAHFSAAILTTALARRRTWPVTIGTFHGLGFPLASGLMRPLLRAAESWSARRLTHVWVLTDDDQRALARTAGASRVTRQAGFGVGCDLNRFSPSRFTADARTSLRARLGFAEADFVVTFVGRFTHFKGFDAVCRGFLEAARSHARLRLLLIGSKDPLHPTGLRPGEYEELIHSERVVDVGWRNDTDTLLAISDVAVLPSQREGMPVCLMEALAMGVPVITAATRGCREIVRHGVDGSVLADCAPSQIAQAIGNLASSPEMHSSFGRNALAGRQRFDRRIFVAQQVRAYLRLIGERPRPDRIAS